MSETFDHPETDEGETRPSGARVRATWVHIKVIVYGDEAATEEVDFQLRSGDPAVDVVRRVIDAAKWAAEV